MTFRQALAESRGVCEQPFDASRSPQRGEQMQPDYKDLAELALICARHSRLAESESVAGELWRLAKDYQERAAKLDRGTLPDIGHAPYSR